MGPIRRLPGPAGFLPPREGRPRVPSWAPGGFCRASDLRNVAQAPRRIRTPFDDCSVWDDIMEKYSATEYWVKAFQLGEDQFTGKVSLFVGLVQGLANGETNSYCRLLDKTGSVNVAFAADCVEELGLRNGDVLVVRDVAVVHGSISHRALLVVGSDQVVEIARSPSPSAAADASACASGSGSAKK